MSVLGDGPVGDRLRVERRGFVKAEGTYRREHMDRVGKKNSGHTIHVW